MLLSLLFSPFFYRLDGLKLADQSNRSPESMVSLQNWFLNMPSLSTARLNENVAVSLNDHLMLQHSGLFCLKSLSHKHIICLGDW